MPELRKSVWEKEFIKDFFPSSTFLKEAEDKSSMVDNDKIHLAELGVDPEVLINNNSFPIGIVEGTDTPREILLETMSTVNTVVREINKAARAQNLRKEYMAPHKRNMMLKYLERAAWSFSLATVDAAKGNVVVPTTGNDRGDGNRAATFADLHSLAAVYQGKDVPLEDVNVVLTIEHLNELKQADLKEYKELMESINEGKISTRFGMKFHVYSRCPYYTIADNTKLAFGAAPAAGDHRASFAFVKSEVVRAWGTVKMFARLDDPEAEGDIFHFHTRFIASQKRDMYRSLLMTKAVA